VLGCTDSSAFNYNSEATASDESCLYPSISIGGISDGQVFELNNVVASLTVSDFTVGAGTGDGHIHYHVNGNMVMQYDLSDIVMNLSDGSHTLMVELVDNSHQPFAANYSDEVSFSVAVPVPGCTDSSACNYVPSATNDDGSCEYVYDCAGTCGGELELDCCGVCGGDNSQCSDCCGMPFPEDCSSACYADNCGTCDDDATNDCVQDCAGTWGGDSVVDECGICGGSGITDGTCDCDGNVLDELGVCGGECPYDFDGNGTCDDQEIYGCTYPSASNYNSEATSDDGSCVLEPCTGGDCPFDSSGDGEIGTADLLDFLVAFGSSCEQLE
jgi:hypothetical protein